MRDEQIQAPTFFATNNGLSALFFANVIKF
jgi:hypothetical protein